MILYIKCELNYDGIEKITKFCCEQHKEELIENEICFNAYIVEIGELEGYTVILSMMRRKQNIKMSLGVFRN
jgi:hypothetical protein